MEENAGAADVVLSAGEVQALDEALDHMEMSAVFGGIDDFSYYSSQAAGEQYLANVRIPAAEIKAGTSASGKVYFTVYK